MITEPPIRVRSLFISDVHLGTRACQAEQLLGFIKNYSTEHIFLLGDIVDLWAMSRDGIYWPAPQNTVVQKLLRSARHGTRVCFIPGNHDESLREYVGVTFGAVEIMREHVHTAADGKRYLLIHGDDFYQVTLHHRWVARLGDKAYNLLVRLNIYLSWLRRRLRRPGYWSLAGYAKSKIKTAVSFIFNFEEAVMHHVAQRGMDGVICGHIHWPVIKDINNRQYLNCGDWVDSCSAIVEHMNGEMELVYWNRSK